MSPSPALVLEKPQLRLGIVPLVDATPIVVAYEKGFFAKHGLDVVLTTEGSWASIRDKVAAGLLDAAHMLAPMTIAASLGIDGVGVPMITALSLNLNGNAITLSEALYWRLQAEGADAISIGRALKRVIDANRADGAPPLVFAHVFPFSTHHYELRYWLAGCGIDPDRDVELAVIPPPQMVSALGEGRIDGFCVGAPWGAVAETAGAGRIVVSKHQIWNNSPEKVLGVTRDWAERNPNTHLALLCALLETSRWLGRSENRSEAARLLVEGRYLEAGPEIVHAVLSGTEVERERGAGLVFHAGAATFPWVSHAIWFIEQMRRWKQIPQAIDAAKAATQIYRPDLYRKAAKRVGTPYPRTDWKSEGRHAEPWRLPVEAGGLILGSDRFFDGAVFDPPRD